MMIYSNDVRNGLFFGVTSSRSLDRACMNVSYSLSQIASPYYDLTSNVRAIGHPFFHATQLLRDAGHFVYGAFVLVGALATGHWSAAGKATLGMFQLIGAAALEILNIALSVISLATRLVASLFNFGYVSTNFQLPSTHVNGAAKGDTDTMRVLEGLGNDIINYTAQAADEAGHQAAFALI